MKVVFFALVVGAGVSVLASSVVGCGGSASEVRGPSTPDGTPLSPENAAVVDREGCVKDWPVANQLPDAERIADLAERCRQEAAATVQKLAPAVDTAVAGEDTGSAGEAGSGDTDPTTLQRAVEKLRAARARLATATQGANQTEERRELIDHYLSEARAYRLGVGFHAATAAAAGNRTFQRLGGSLLLRMDPSLQVDLTVSADHVRALTTDEDWRASGLALALIGQGRWALALGAGAGLHASDDAALPIITHVGVQFRPFPYLGCQAWLPVTDVSVFAEHWYLNGDALPTDPHVPPVFFGIGMTLGLGGSSAGDPKFLTLDGVTAGCQ
jgi:hypothetical protein